MTVPNKHHTHHTHQLSLDLLEVVGKMKNIPQMMVFHGDLLCTKKTKVAHTRYPPKVWYGTPKSLLCSILIFQGASSLKLTAKAPENWRSWKMKPPVGMAYFRVGELLVLGSVHPGRLTWNIIIEVWKIIFLSKWVIWRFHVNLPGCNPLMSRFQGSAIAVSCRSAKTPKPWATPMHSPGRGVEWFVFFLGGGFKLGGDVVMISTVYNY